MITATYSPEDNKIRLYADRRLDAETFERVKAVGFKWAPKQELFVAPKWTPQREDLAVELAGEIEPESMTMAERAAIKSERLAAIAENKRRKANAYAQRADRLSEAFSGGQPILMGHHSQRKAEKTVEQMRSAQTKANENMSAIDYWLYRAESVQHHANYKNGDRTRSNRIKTLLKELRDLQRGKNEAALRLAIWEMITSEEAAAAVIEHNYNRGHVRGVALEINYGIHKKVQEGELAALDVRADLMKREDNIINGPMRARWIQHVLGRLSYERTLLGAVSRFTDEITPAALQIFAREHGAHKPKATAHDGDRFTLESPAPLPLHLTEGHTIDLTADEWRDLMESVGYEPPVKKAGPPPILNFRADSLTGKRPYYAAQPETFRQIEMTKADYNAIHSDSRWIMPSACGEYRFRVAPDPTCKQPYYMRKRVAVFLTDSKAHPAPNAENEEAA